MGRPQVKQKPTHYLPEVPVTFQMVEAGARVSRCSELAALLQCGCSWCSRYPTAHMGSSRSVAKHAHSLTDIPQVLCIPLPTSRACLLLCPSHPMQPCDPGSLGRVETHKAPRGKLQVADSALDQCNYASPLPFYCPKTRQATCSQASIMDTSSCTLWQLTRGSDSQTQLLSW